MTAMVLARLNEKRRELRASALGRIKIEAAKRGWTVLTPRQAMRRGIDMTVPFDGRPR